MTSRVTNPMQSRSHAGELGASSIKTLALASVLSLALGCRSQGGPAEASSASGAAAAEEAKAPEPTRSADTAQNRAAPADALAFIDLGPGRFALRANTPISIATTAQLERSVESSGFQSVPLPRGFRLTERCEAPAAECRALRAGEVFAPGAWNGGDCAGACCPSGSSPDGKIPDGAHRFAVSQCDDPKVRWLGPAFELPKSVKAMYRARAAANVESATVMQLNALDTADDLTANAGRVAGVAVVKGTEAPLPSSAVAALVRWLAGSGFDDDVVRRCKRADAFGFRLARKTSGLAPEVTEVAVDLACNSVGVVHEEGSERLRSDAFFDASREELIAILKSAMPSAVGSAR